MSSKFVWRMSGLTYYTAIRATHGRYASKEGYLNAGREEMSIFFKYFDKSKFVIEFGCGPGKNLFGIQDRIKSGYGIDINSLFIKLANKLKKHYRMSNLSFIKYDGINFPIIHKADVIFEKGVFERIPKPQVKYYIESLKGKYLCDNGVIILYFLMDRAISTKFTELLGNDSYVFWTDVEVKKLLKEANLKVIEVKKLEYADFYICNSVSNI